MHTGNDRDIHTESASGKIVAVYLSEERGTVKRNVGAGYLKEGYGLLGDARIKVFPSCPSAVLLRALRRTDTSEWVIG